MSSLPPPSDQEKPLAVFYGGTNGSGKSTLRGEYQDSSIEVHIDPDRIARSINPDDPRSADIAAGKKSVEFFNSAISNSMSFTMESTLTGKSIIGRMQKAKDAGFKIELRYVGLESADLNVTRVAERVAKGGHHIDEHVIRKRYDASRENLAAASLIANRVVVWDNSGPKASLCATINEGVLEIRKGQVLPEWIADVLKQISPILKNSPIALQKLLGAPLPKGSFGAAVKRIERDQKIDSENDQEP